MDEFIKKLEDNGISFTSTPEGVTILDNKASQDAATYIPQWATACGVVLKSIYVAA